MLVHAGEDKSGGGGAQGVYSIWAHSSSVPGGADVPGTGLKLDNYIVQPEDSGVGVFSHEYGHDLGLPDLYDTSGAGDSDVDFWDLMSTGSHSGPIFQSMPTHMGLWDKWILGWADPLILEPGKDARDVQLGQNSRTPVGTKDGIRVSLPQKVISLATPHSGAVSWWSNNDQDWADVRLTRDVAVPAGTDVRFWLWNNYIIEADWDYGFLEVSTDGGATWAEQVIYDQAGTPVTTPDNYGDPNGRMADYGGKKRGLTGTSNGWRRDFSVTNGPTTVWSDDTESGANGWTNTVASWTGTTTGAGWMLDPGSSTRNHYYLAEWRNLDGFDQGLKYAYDSTYTPDAAGGAWKVSKVNYNAPGMLVWYRDTSYGSNNHVVATTFDLPSVGSKGGLLIVDSHFDPLRHTGAAAEKYNDGESGLENFPTRMQSSNAAFSAFGTYPTTDCFIDSTPDAEYCSAYGNLGGVQKFDDAKGWYPGLELRGNSLFFRDIDASAVIPSRGNQQYSTRIVDADGNPVTSLYGRKLLGGAIVLGSGNPGDEGKSYGVSFEVTKVASGSSYATVHVTSAQP